MDKITIEKYFTISPQFQYSEYKSLESAIDTGGWLLIVIQVKQEDRFIDKIIKATFDYQFVNIGESKQEKEIRFGKWSAILNNVAMCNNNNEDIRAFFKFCAPSGELKTIFLGYNKGLDSISEVSKKLIELNQYGTWQEYELAQENQCLKDQVKILKEKLEKYTTANS